MQLITHKTDPARCCIVTLHLGIPKHLWILTFGVVGIFREVNLYDLSATRLFAVS